MKKEGVVKIQKIFGIILLVIGVLLLCGSIYMLRNFNNYYNEGTVIDRDDETHPINRMINMLENQSLSEHEKLNIEHMMLEYSTSDILYFTPGLIFFSEVLFFSLLLIVLGIMNLLQAAFNNAKR